MTTRIPTIRTGTPFLLAVAAALLGAGLSFGASAQHVALGSCTAANENEIAEIIEDIPGGAFGDYYRVNYICTGGQWLESTRQYCDFEQCYPIE